MSFVLIVRMQAAPGNAERAVEVMKELAAASREEPGVEDYQPCLDPENPSSFVIYERYRDRAAWEEHGETEHFKRLGPGELFPLMESRERQIFETF
jgi:quinol monooxygenase YgiN